MEDITSKETERLDSLNDRSCMTILSSIRFSIRYSTKQIHHYVLNNLGQQLNALNL